MKINFKIVFLFIFVLSLYGIGSYLYVKNSVDSMKTQKYEETIHDMKNTLTTLIKEKKEAVLLMSIFLSNQEDAKKALLSADSSKLHFKYLIDKIKKNTSLHNIWFQVITKNGESLYRSWTKKSGDSLVDVRLDIAKMIHEQKIISSISTGKFDMTFKSIVPIFEKGRFIGAVETIARFNSIVRKMNLQHYATVLFVDKSYKNQLSKAVTKRFVNDYYVSSENPNELIVSIFENNTENILNIKSYLVDVKHDLLLSTYKLADINGKSMGIFVLTKKLSQINISEILYYKQNLILILFTIAFLIFLFLYYLYNVKYKAFIKKQNEKLENDVHLKTEELYYTANHDSLTSLPNRLLFFDRLNQAITYSSRREREFFVLFLDLDRFKEINDTFGHSIGDALLKKVALLLKEVVRAEDTISRLGGDEFTIIVQNVDQANIVKVINKIIKIMQESIHINELELYTSFSIGVSKFPDDGESAEVLVRNADTAMYKAKEKGKNTYYFYNKKMTDIAQERVNLEKSIRKALVNEEFEVYFQPKINAKEGKIVGLEALVRWNHPKKGLVFPDAFIPFSQEIGLIAEIDAYVMKESMKITKKYLDKGLDFGRLSLNASTIQLYKKSFVQMIEKNIVAVEYPANKLEIEILESQSMQHQEKVISILEEIQKMGVSISVDDFGTGYSSLYYLKKLPIDILKIDRSFVKDLPNDTDSVALTKTIIALANNLGLEIIAEGVETKEQVDFLLENGCEAIQGYYFFKPLVASEIEKLLKKNYNKAKQ